MKDEDRDAREALFALASAARVGAVNLTAVRATVGSEGEDMFASVMDGGEHWPAIAIERAAMMGDDWARVALAWRLFKGFDGYVKDEERALEVFRDVAKIGLERGPTTYEIDSSSGGEWLRDKERDATWRAESVANKAPAQLEMEIDAANRGDDTANALLGYRALVGDRGIARDERAAMRHFERAANGAHMPEAHYNLGFLHMQGLGTEKNHTRAREEFAKAIAIGGIAPAYNGMGVLHFQGLGGDQNLSQAFYYFQEAAKREDADGYFNLAQMYATGYEGVVEANITRALEIMTKASELGHWRAPYELGLAYATGHATERNVTKAAELFHTFIEERFHWSREEDNAIEEVIIHRNPWGALVRYAQIASLGSESAANNVAWILRRTKAYVGENKFELAARQLREIIHCYGSPEASVDLADLLAARKAQPDHSDFFDRYEHVTEHAMHHDAAAANRLAKVAFHEDPYPEALVNLGWAHLLGVGVVPNATRAYELFALAYEASEDAYEAAPCITASVIAQIWIIAAKASRRMGLSALGLPDAIFSTAAGGLRTSASSSASTSASASAWLKRFLRWSESIERRMLTVLAVLLGVVLGVRLLLAMVDIIV